jgi:hypothetical protein
LINSLPVRSDELDFFAADARELYRHAKESIFLFLVIGGEGILMHGNNGIVMCAARPSEVWEDLFDNSNEVGFLPREFRLVAVQYGQYLIAFRLKAAIRSRTYQTRADGGFTPSNSRAFQDAVLNSYLTWSRRIWSSSLYSVVILWAREWYSQSCEDVREDSRRRVSICN